MQYVSKQKSVQRLSHSIPQIPQLNEAKHFINHEIVAKHFQSLFETLSKSNNNFNDGDNNNNNNNNNNGNKINRTLILSKLVKDNFIFFDITMFY